MTELFDNNNYYDTVSPTGRNIQGIIPIKKYYVLEHPYTQPTNSLIAHIPILYREGITDHSNQYLYLDIVRTGGGLLQPYLKNQTIYDIKYITILEQQFNNTIQEKNYLQRDTDYTILSKGTTSNPLMTMNNFGTSTDSTNAGNDKGTFNINIQINGNNLNLVGSWYTPLTKNPSSTSNDNLNGWLTLENIDNYLNLV